MSALDNEPPPLWAITSAGRVAVAAAGGLAAGAAEAYAIRLQAVNNKIDLNIAFPQVNRVE
jgi:hypothetical protein